MFTINVYTWLQYELKIPLTLFSLITLIWVGVFGDVGPPFVSRTPGRCVLYPSISCSDNVVDK